MFVAVVPVMNEEKCFKKTLQTLLSTPCGLIIPVINGCWDNSYEIAVQFNSPRISPLLFKDALGIDVPRAIGAKAAMAKGASGIIFVDGDMGGDIGLSLNELILKVESGQADMALTNCYPDQRRARLSSLATSVLKARFLLNREINLKKLLGGASPCHGPHAVSLHFLRTVPLRELAVPPVSLGLAAKYGLKICIGATIAHRELGSQEKGAIHSELIAETIIGDCLEAISVWKGKQRNRSEGGKAYDGYNNKRRWDLLEEFFKQ